MGGQSAAVLADEDELHFVTHQRVDSDVVQPRFDALECSPTAIGVGLAVLTEESAWRPGQSVAEDPQRAQVDSDSLIADDAEVVAGCDAGLVDGEDVPDRAGTQSGVGECAHPAQWNGFRLRQARGVDDRADEGGHPV